MSIYTRKQRWKLFLFAGALVIGLASTWYTNVLVRKLEAEEKLRMETWAEATKLSLTIDTEKQVNLFLFVSKVIETNHNIPVITVDQNGQIITARNLRLYDRQNRLADASRLQFQELSQQSLRYLNRQFAIMKKQHDPIVIDMAEVLESMKQQGQGVMLDPAMFDQASMKQYLYYKDSILLTRIQYFPMVQLAVVFLFILLAYLGFSSSRRAEQNQVWVGMSKETAHQLGTPISSLMAWLELIKIKQSNPQVIQEVEKDVRRLETIADRFSKIGSAPVLVRENILLVLENSVAYLRNRSSEKVKFRMDFGDLDELYLPLNITLFEWVVENLCRNAIDAMNGNGEIELAVRDHNQVIYLDITDNGKGIPKSNYQLVFQPGYTTKPRGWGLGLSLVKRIIENYHSGKVFVKSSELNKGTTFRIVLKK